MITLGAVVGVYIVSVIIGKKGHRLTAGTVVLLLFLALLQTGIVLAEMYSKHVPLQ